MNDSNSSKPSPQLEGETNKELENENQQSPGDVTNNALVSTASRIQWHQHQHTTPVENQTLERDLQGHSWLKFRMRGFDDDEITDWWFAGTAVPLIAATLAPLANVLSLAALVTPWREDLDDGQGNRLPELQGMPFRDPRWIYDLNVVSLVCGFVGNLFLLFNFTGRISYIIALPATILIWYVATGIVGFPLIVPILQADSRTDISKVDWYHSRHAHLRSTRWRSPDLYPGFLVRCRSRHSLFYLLHASHA
jgi:hypothetical protein